MIFKAEDGTRIYARTMEWGASDLKSEMMLAPRAMAFRPRWATARPARRGRTNMALSASTRPASPYATDGMNEAGLTVGALFFPGFAKYQEVKADELATTVSNVDLVNYILEQLQDRG